MTTIDLTQALTDRFMRRITYLRISLTDRCNLRCVYCMPEAGLPWIPNSDTLSFDEIVAIVEAAASVGVRSIRLTGGEPLIRPRLVDLVSRIARVPGIEDIALSTNGLLLADMAASLKQAGLCRVNVSLDTLRPDRFAAIARRPGLERVLDGIDAALRAGLSPVKINCVLMRGHNDDELPAFARYAAERRVFIRFIEAMPVHENVALQSSAYISGSEIISRLGAELDLVPTAGPHGNGPARYYGFPGAEGGIGVITPLSHDYCERCNRVRLTADGKLRLCLFGDDEVDLRSPLRGGATRGDLVEIFRNAMSVKPERHHLEVGKTASSMRAFSQIGG